MRRACKISLRNVTARKLRAVEALIAEYRNAVNCFIKQLWVDGGMLDKRTLDSLPDMHLTKRYKSQALKQALETISATRKSAKALGTSASRPFFRGSPILDAKFIKVEDSHSISHFDLVITLSTLKKRARIALPAKRTRVLNKWMAMPGARFVQGTALQEGMLVLWVDIPNEEVDQDPVSEDEVLGIDIGINKLIADSDGNFYGTEFKRVRDKIVRRERGSRGYRRALRERDILIDKAVNALPWGSFKVLGVEDLRGIKRGKSKNRSKTFRKKAAPWTVRRVKARLAHKAEAHRVRLVPVVAAHTSQECPVCGTVSRRNRRGEDFVCVACGHKADADVVGAQNVLARTLGSLGSVESPGLQKVTA